MFRNLHELIYFGKKLRVHTQTTVQFVTRFRAETFRKLLLKHDDCATKERAMFQEFENQTARYLVGDICTAHIKIRQIDLEGITL